MTAEPALPIWDEDAERAVLGAMLVNAEAAKLVAKRLKRGDFYRPSHGRIFAAACQLLERDGVVDMIMLAGAVDHRDRALARSVPSDVPSVANAPLYVERVIDTARRRQQITAAERVMEAARNGGVTEVHAAEVREAIQPGRTGKLSFTGLAGVGMRSVEWLEKPLWQRSAFHLLAAPKGAGKGTYTARLAAKMTTGQLGPPRSVVFVSSEDSPEIDIVPRLTAAGADINLCFHIPNSFRLPDDLPHLREVMAEIGDVGMLVLDPLANHIGQRNSNDEADVRHSIAPLNDLADQCNCLVIGIRHPGKSRESGAIASILGSTAWVDTPRAVVMIAVDHETEIRHIQVVAGNRSARRGGVQFRIEAVDVPGLTEPIPVAVELGESDRDIEELFMTKATSAAEASRSAAARTAILDLLDDAPGGYESDALDAEVAKQTGLAVKTLRNLRTELAKQGLIRTKPILGEDSAPAWWMVYRTNAPR